MMDKAKQVSRRLFLMIHWVSVASITLSFVYVPFSVMEQHTLLAQIIIYATWICTTWWFSLMITLIWRTANYVYAEMKITLTDGEIIHYSCSPQMCRVHKNYLRLLKRDEKGVIVYERHINEAMIREIEYF